MAKIINITNTTISDGDWVGQTIFAGQSYTILADEVSEWADDSEVFASIGSGDLLINDGTNDLTDPTVGYKWLNDVNDFPVSDVDGKKIAVHSSPKPLNNGTVIYAIWAGAGDDMTTGEISGGDLLELDQTPGNASTSVDMKFYTGNGKVWLHEGYLKFDNGGSGDYVEATIVAEATPLQTAVNLDLIVTNNKITYSTSGAGTGTHGFADATKIVLTPRSYSNDGNWDYDGLNLTPNFTNTGAYDIYDIEQMVHRFIHRIPVKGSSNNYFNMSSEESTEMPVNYFMRVTAHNISDTTWSASIIVELYRERTFNP